MRQDFNRDDDGRSDPVGGAGGRTAGAGPRSGLRGAATDGKREYLGDFAALALGAAAIGTAVVYVSHLSQELAAARIAARCSEIVIQKSEVRRQKSDWAAGRPDGRLRGGATDGRQNAPVPRGKIVPQELVPGGGAAFGRSPDGQDMPLHERFPERRLLVGDPELVTQDAPGPSPSPNHYSSPESRFDPNVTTAVGPVTCVRYFRQETRA